MLSPHRHPTPYVVTVLGVTLFLGCSVNRGGLRGSRDASTRGDIGVDASLDDATIDTSFDAQVSDVMLTVACGDSIVAGDELCDDGNTTSGDGCSATCDSLETCGNGIIDVGERCDDGNRIDGDECSADCLTSALCGNRTLDVGEECDDGNRVGSDGCSADCRVERCGNGRVEAFERCDDANTIETDGCRSNCRFTCSADGECDDTLPCNGVEVCMNANTVTSRCRAGPHAADGVPCGPLRICRSGLCLASECGDGVTDALRGEACDDGNAALGDGCEPTCTFTCTRASDCLDMNACNGDEICRNGSTTASACAPGIPLIEGSVCGFGSICHRGACVAPGCGDGITSNLDECDDGNAISGDGCEPDCRYTCAGDDDCRDSSTCNGAEICVAPASLSSRCAAGAPLPNGSFCGVGRLCVSGSCVPTRCGDGYVTAPEACDDADIEAGDGCEPSCQWTCTSDASCGDENPCNGSESCSAPGTIASRCNAGAPLANGAICDADTFPPSLEICRHGDCVSSTCGDTLVDTRAVPPEQCDDGNNASGDGCDAGCQTEFVTPTAFRVTNLDLVSPRIVAGGIGCSDFTSTVNTYLDLLLTTSDGSGAYQLSMVDVFRPLSPASAASRLDVFFDARCTFGSPRPSCAPPSLSAMPIIATATNQSVGACFTAIASDVNTRAGTPATYSPGVSTPTGPCFVADLGAIAPTIAGTTFRFENARLAATYSGTPTGTLVNGVLAAFMTEQVAADTMLSASLPIVGGAPLYSRLQTGGRSIASSGGASVPPGCNIGGGAAEDDADSPSPFTRGFWFFFNFQASRADWSGS